MSVLFQTETMFGTMIGYKIVLTDGHVLIWFSKPIYNENVPTKISFTIKEHSEYNGTPQTKVTRCNLKYGNVA